MDKLQDTIDVLKMYNQNHIINLLNNLEGSKREELLEQLNKIDFHQVFRQTKINKRTKRKIWQIRWRSNKK